MRTALTTNRPDEGRDRIGKVAEKQTIHIMARNTLFTTRPGFRVRRSR